MRGDRMDDLRNAISLDVSARDPLAAHHVRLAAEGSALDIARQAFVDRDQLRPLELTPRINEPPCADAWRDGTPVPDEQKDAFAAWLVNHTTHRREMSELERRLRTSMESQLRLEGSDQETDRRMASAFKRWHLEHWGLADVPKAAPVGRDQPLEKQLMAALRRRTR